LSKRWKKQVLPAREGIARQQYWIVIRKELFRKTIHLCSALVPFFLTLARIPVLIALAVVLALYIVSELLRLRGINIPLVSAITAAAARKRDENKFVLGPVTLVLGIMGAALLWKQMPATVGIYALSFGDGLASVAGRLIGRVTIPLTKGKTVAGSLTCFTAIFLSCFLVTKSSFVALCIASCGMLIEMLPLKDFDNILIPVLLGGLAQLLLHL